MALTNDPGPDYQTRTRSVHWTGQNGTRARGPSATDDPPDEPRPNHLPVLGDYQLLEPIGSGGMGQVFKAQHLRMKRIVAVKTLPPSLTDLPEAVNRFHREVQAAAQLFHPNIVAAFDAGEQDGIHYLVMEYVDGLLLSDLVRQEGPLSLPAALNYLFQAAKGLRFAHQRQIVHRDIKPGNLMVTHERVVKILDMGLARPLSAPGADLTATGVLVGTIQYVAPEQIRDPRRVDHRCDIYSLGCTFHFMLTGKPVYEGDLIHVALAHAERSLPSLCVARQDVPLAVDVLFQQMAAKDPDKRFQSMDEVLTALERLGSGSSLRGMSGAVVGAHRTADPKDSGLLSTTADTVLLGGDRADSLRPTVPAVAIDLGGATSRIAWIDAQGRPALVSVAAGATETRSVLMVRGLNFLVGNAADELRHEEPGLFVDNIVAHLGEGRFPKPLGGTAYPPEALLALLFRKIADDARRQIGHFDHVMLTVPAAYDELRRAAVQHAGYIAGLQVMDLVNKPLAAVTAWCCRQGLLSGGAAARHPFTLLVYRLGASSFDATVFHVEGCQVQALASRGELGLGRRSFQQRIADQIADAFRTKHGLDVRDEPLVAVRLLRKAEQALHALAHASKVAITFGHHRSTVQTIVTRDQLEVTSKDLIDRTGRIVAETLEDADIHWPEINQTLLIGPLAHTPVIRRMLGRMAGHARGHVCLEEASIAEGAAIHAAGLLPHISRFFQPISASDVISHSLGVVGTSPTSGQSRNAVVIPRNARLPAVGKRRFRARPLAGQKLSLLIVRGDDPNPDHCQVMGTCSLDDLPVQIPEGAVLHVEFHVRTSGRLGVIIEVAATGERFTLDVEHPNQMTHDKLLRWREWLDTTVLCAGVE